MAISNGPLLNSTPAAIQQALSTNYLDLNTSTGWGQQYVPDLMEQEAEVFGPRTISGFLAQVGAEEAMSADQVIWSEQGRLHLSYVCKTASTTTILIQGDIDENNYNALGIETGAGATHGVRVNDTIIISDVNQVVKALVISIVADTITIAPYGATTITHTNVDKGTTILVYGSEYGKGQNYFTEAGVGNATDARGANQPSFLTYSNKPIILKDYYEVSGSDAARIGWVEVTSEMGASGYLWYLKAEADTRARFNDYLEMAMLEGVKGVPGSSIADSTIGTAGDNFGMEGLFAAITSRGNLTSGVTGVNAATDLAEFDAILAEFDKQGAIEENMMFVNRATSLAMDDMLASMNSYGAGGTSYGVFDNSADMALNLGFSGFRRGSYDFYKSDFRYLNDLATRGSINAANAAEAIRGVIIPAGTSSVYDQMLGKNLKRPFLHVRYRASQTDNRKMKTWVTGSVGAATSALDAMQIHMLSERCLVTQGANNFMLMN
jgi:hypothetical protein